MIKFFAYRNFPNTVRPRNYYAPRLWSRNVQKSSKPPDNTHPLLIKFSRELSMVCDATVTQTRGSHLVNWSFNVCWPRRHDQLSVIMGFSPRNLRDLKVMFYERSSISQRIEFFKRLEIHTVKKTCLLCARNYCAPQTLNEISTKKKRTIYGKLR